MTYRSDDVLDEPRRDDAAPAVRTIALVDVLPHGRRLTHTSDHPLDPAAMLPDADVVLLVSDADGGAMLFRYSAFGEVCGDTWHPTLEMAREQAAEEYEGALHAWVTVPDDVRDAHHFAVRYAADRLNDREGR
jgi:hypothetical protein